VKFLVYFFVLKFILKKDAPLKLSIRGAASSRHSERDVQKFVEASHELFALYHSTVQHLFSNFKL
jgi:hypothetical protein